VKAPFELKARVASGIILVGVGVLVVVIGAQWFVTFAAIAGSLGLYEWHRLVNVGKLSFETVVGIVAIILAVVFAHLHLPLYCSAAAIVAGSVAAALSAAARRSWVLWHAFGAIYLGVPTLALVVMREDQIRGGAIVGGLFAAVWAADTAALFVGRALGGPRLAPKLSPNKTWSGFIGGVVAAGIAEAIYVAFFVGAVWQGALFGLFLGVAAACGDLFESWVKRQFHAKNSGALIPGHGGMLDRIDSLLLAAPAGAAILFLSGVDLFGAVG
jgi:phosphatidate cytidylyltransferase